MLSRLIINLKKLYINNSMTTLIHAFAGNIGIGTTDPGAYKLRVEGAAKMDSLQVNGVTNSHVPIGLISMWYGTIGTIPTGWHVCDGTTGISRTDGAGTINAPDLRDRFVRGAAGDAAPAPTIQGALGGANTVTLAANNLAAHVHPTQTQTNNAPHSHYVDANNAPHAHNSQAVNAPHAHNSQAVNAPHSHYVDANNAPHAHNSQAANAPHGHNTNYISDNHSHPYSIYGLRYGEVPVTVWNGQSMAAYAHSFYYGGNTGNVNNNHWHGVHGNNAPHSHWVDGSNAPHDHNSRAANAPHSHYVDAGNANHSHYVDANNAPHAHNSRAADAPHTHSVTIGSNSTNNNAVTVENPYYALYYIMKI